MNGSASNPRRCAFGAAALLALASSVACRGERHVDAIELVVPDGSGRTLELVPRAAFAEYVEVPDAANELRVTLATFDVSCERYVAAGAEDSMLILTLKMPPSEKPHTGSYPSTPPLPVDGGTDSVGRAYAVTVVRRGGSFTPRLYARPGVVATPSDFRFPWPPPRFDRTEEGRTRG